MQEAESDGESLQLVSESVSEAPPLGGGGWLPYSSLKAADILLCMRPRLAEPQRSGGWGGDGGH